MAATRSAILLVLCWITFVGTEPAGAQQADTPAAGSVSLSAGERAWLSAHPDIVLGYTDSLEPAVIAGPNGAHTGMLVDALEQLNQRLGTRIKLRLYDIPTLIENAKSKKVDGIISIHPDYAEKLGLRPTKVYWPEYLAVFARRATPFRGVEDFADKRVALIDKVYTTQKMIDQHGKRTTVVKVPTALEGLQAVARGDADYVLCASLNTYLTNKYQLLEIVPVHVFLDTPTWQCVGVRSDWPELVTILNKGLSGFSERDAHNIIRKWSYLPAERKGLGLTEEEQAWIKNHPVIRLGIDQSWEPYVFVVDGVLVKGFDVELLNRINELTGCDIELVTGEWKTLVDQAKRREIDGLAESAVTDERKEWFVFSDSYRSHYYALITTPDNKKWIDKPSDLIGKRVSIQAGNLWIRKTVESIKDVQIVEADTQAGAFGLVVAGKADAACVGMGTGNELQRDFRPMPVVMAHVFYDHRLDVVYSIRKDWPEMAGILNKALAAISDDERARLLKKYSLNLPEESEPTVDLTRDEQLWLDQKHTVRVRVVDFPPYMIPHKDGPAGISVDYLKLIAQRTGIDFEFVTEQRSFADALAGLTENRGPDLIQCMASTADRENELNFTQEYVSSPRVIYARNDRLSIAGMDDLKGKTVAVPDGATIGEKIAAQYPGVHLLPKDSDLDCLEAVSLGEVDAYVGNLTVATYLIMEHELPNLKIAAPSPFEDHVLSYGIRSDWPELGSIIDKGLSSITSEEKVAIRGKYLSLQYEHGIRASDILKWGSGIGVAALAIVLFFVCWNRTLKREVADRTADILEKEARFRRLVEQTPMAIEIHDLEGKIVQANQAFAKLHNLEGEALNHVLTHYNLRKDEQAQKLGLQPYIERVYAGEDVVFPPYKYSTDETVKRLGHETVPHELWTQVRGFPLRDSKGNMTAVVFFAEDITEQREAQEALKEERAYTDHLIQTANVMIVSLDMNGVITNMNPAAEEITGYKEGELKGLNWFDLIVPEDRYPEVREVFDKVAEDNLVKHFENHILTKDGKERFISWSNSEIKQAGEVVGLISFGMDITERKRAETALRGSEEKFRAVIDQSPVSIQIHGLDGKLVTSNEAYRKLYAFSDDVLAEVYEKYNVLEDEEARRLGLMECIKKVYAGEDVVFPPYEYDGVDTLKTLDFERRISRTCWIQTRGFPLKDEAGRVTSVVFMSTDFTERKQAEDALKDSEEKFRQLVEQSPISIQVMDPDGRITKTNQAWMDLWGFSEEGRRDVLSSYNMLEDEQARDRGVMPLIETAFRGEAVVLPVIEYDLARTMGTMGLKEEGGKVWMQVRLYPVKDGLGNVVSVVGIEEDISERRQAEEKIRAHQERLRALAAELTLTEEQERRRIATELHDGPAQSLAYARIELASAIKSCTDIPVTTKLDDLSQLLRESLQQIREALLDLSSPALNEIGLAAALSEWLEEQVGRRHGLQVSFVNECGPVSLTEDVRAVLFRNARELLANVVKHSQAEKVSVRMEASEGAIRISVEDDGVGFAAQSANDTSHGEGSYGLFSILERMRDLDGSLEIVSEPGKGCRAVLIAPVGEG